MLLDRFLLKSLLITRLEDAAPSYSRADEENLIWLTRGMNENYLPAPLEALARHVVPVQTFANVRFFAVNEGIAAHVKPRPGPGQDFLRTEFSSRIDSEYMLLFVLAVYQHYRLIDQIRTLARKTADLNENNLDSGRIDQLHKLREKLTVHDVKYINTQPAFLTNYQQYYTGLRQGMNTRALVEKLRRSVAELDMLPMRSSGKRRSRRNGMRRANAHGCHCGNGGSALLFAQPAGTCTAFQKPLGIGRNRHCHRRSGDKNCADHARHEHSICR